MTATAAVWNFTVDQGARWAKTITWETGADFDTTSPVNLTGYTARMKIKTAPGAPDTLVSLTSGSGITLGGTAGTIALELTAAQTAELPTGRRLSYDLDLIDGSARPTRIVRGEITVEPGTSHN